MKVLVEEQHDLPLVEMYIGVRTGPAADPAGKEGRCRHAFELMRRGAGEHTRASLDAAFDGLGATVNTSLSHESVGLDLRCLSRNLDEACDLAAAVFARPRLEADEHEHLRRESLAELDELRDDDSSLAARFFDRYALAGHAYGRTALGTEESLAGLRREDAAAWFTDNVVRDHLIVAFAGDITPARAEALALRLVAALPTRPAPLGAEIISPVAPPARRTFLIDKPERAQSQILIGHAAPPPAHPDFLALRVAGAAFGGTFTSRLMTEVRVKRGWSYGASFRAARARAGHSFRMRIAPSAEQTPDALALILSLWEDARRGLGDDEIAFVKSFLEGSWAFEIDTPGARLERRLEALDWGLPEDEPGGYLERLRAVTPAQVNEAIARHWHPERATVVLTATAEGMLPRLAGLPLGELEVVDFETY